MSLVGEWLLRGQLDDFDGLMEEMVTMVMTVMMMGFTAFYDWCFLFLFSFLFFGISTPLDCFFSPYCLPTPMMASLGAWEAFGGHGIQNMGGKKGLNSILLMFVGWLRCVWVWLLFPPSLGFFFELGWGNLSQFFWGVFKFFAWRWRKICFVNVLKRREGGGRQAGEADFILILGGERGLPGPEGFPHSLPLLSLF